MAKTTLHADRIGLLTRIEAENGPQLSVEPYDVPKRQYCRRTSAVEDRLLPNMCLMY